MKREISTDQASFFQSSNHNTILLEERRTAGFAKKYTWHNNHTWRNSSASIQYAPLYNQFNRIFDSVTSTIDDSSDLLARCMGWLFHSQNSLSDLAHSRVTNEPELFFSVAFRKYFGVFGGTNMSQSMPNSRVNFAK